MNQVHALILFFAVTILSVEASQIQKVEGSIAIIPEYTVSSDPLYPGVPEKLYDKLVIFGGHHLLGDVTLKTFYKPNLKLQQLIKSGGPFEIKVKKEILHIYTGDRVSGEVSFQPFSSIVDQIFDLEVLETKY